MFRLKFFQKGLSYKQSSTYFDIACNIMGSVLVKVQLHDLDDVKNLVCQEAI